ncbi:Hypothetical protein P9515_13811 [Prochlorococcus marinus str. MIT 9515]|uniref:Glycosyl transferase family 1 domain-containing protein n=1 Tax=Prochlorococcus marinus (strain MIT 9515) TaxID=167542 RepID=A2BXS7_PROM5|nr:glycosyltransferase [Prochlorococcus marinus]ABM72588.1 Hypothetical protein P9515_13811 [Prochlorococcus marinus str. MIT 9515]
MDKSKIKSCDILIVLNSLVAEGCPQLALNLAEYWTSKKKKIEIICFDKDPLEIFKEFEEISIDVHFYKDFKNKFFRYFFLTYYTYKICIKLKPKAILCFPFGWHAFIAIGAKFAGVRSICTHIGNYPPIYEKSIQKFRVLVHLGRFFTKKCICCSDYIMQASRKHFYLPNKALCRVYNCCDLNKFYDSKNKFEIKPDKTINLGMVARLEKHKDHETLIRSIFEMKKNGLKVILSIIGDGSKRKELEKLSKDLGIDSMIKFLGARRDIPKIISQLDIFVFSAKQDEGFGIALAEAMVAGIPILASNVGSCLEILGNGKYGNFFKEGDPKDLAIKVSEMTHDSKSIYEKSLKARKYAIDNFSIEKMAEAYFYYLML